MNKKIVDDLIRIDGVIGALLVEKDGLVVYSTLLEEEDAEALGAMAASVYGELSGATQRLGLGAMRDAIIEAAEGSLQIMSARDLVLVVLCEPPVNLGEIRLAMRKATRRISEDFPS